MRTYSAAFAALLFGAVHAETSLVRAADTDIAGHPIDLTDTNFHEFIEDKALAVVYFHAPWCKHCREFMGEYSKTAELLNEVELDIPLAIVDGSQNRKLVEEFEIDTYPTIQIFRHGQGNLYHGPRYSYAMQAYLKDKMLVNMTAIASEDELAVFRDEHNEMPTAVYFNADDGDGYKRFEGMCLALSETLSCGKAAYVSESRSGGFLFKPQKWKSKSDEMVVEIEGSTPLAMAAFVDSNRLPLVCVRSPYADRYVKDTTRPIVTMLYNIDYATDPKGTNYIANRLRRVAKSFAGRATFFIEHGNDKSYREHGLSQGGFAPDSSEYIIMITLGAQERWVYDGVVGQNKLTFKIEGLGDYLENILNADVESRPKMYKLSTDHTQPFYQDDWDYEKEEIVPSVQSSILTVTANTFDEVVTNGNRDVFMMFAAPWCIHCIAFLEFYEPIAKKHLKSKSGPIIAHMDAERNNLSDDFDIQGYPSFFWIPKNGGTPTRYTGGYIDAEGVEEFLQTMRKH